MPKHDGLLMSSESNSSAPTGAPEDAAAVPDDYDSDDDLTLGAMRDKSAARHASEQSAASAMPSVWSGQPSHVGGIQPLVKAFALCPGPPGCTAKCPVGELCPKCCVFRVLPEKYERHDECLSRRTMFLH